MFTRILLTIAALAISALASPMDLTSRQAVQPVDPGRIARAHNIHRSNHSASDLTWSDELAGYAQTLAQRCVFDHDNSIGSGDYGQNLAGGNPSVADAVHNSWYNGEEPKYAPYYGEPNVPDGVFGSVGHFTQVVWKNTKEVGCARVHCDNNVGDFTVCNYRPAGNFGGEYGNNVGRPLGHPIVRDSN